VFSLSTGKAGCQFTTVTRTAANNIVLGLQGCLTGIHNGGHICEFGIVSYIYFYSVNIFFQLYHRDQFHRLLSEEISPVVSHCNTSLDVYPITTCSWKGEPISNIQIIVSIYKY
jgi:hypothetical protein